MNFFIEISSSFTQAMLQEYAVQINENEVQISITKKEFTGDYTIVLFPFTKITRDKPESIGERIGSRLVENLPIIKSFNVIKGFLNLELSDNFWFNILNEILSTPSYGKLPSNGQKVMVEYSSPNTNKPLHLGHIRNILLGWSTSKILEANGYDVVKTQIINDRGIAICKSMVAWQKFGDGKTPESENVKSDHFVGEYYVLFENKFQEEYKSWQESAEAKQWLATKNVPEAKESEFFKINKNIYFNEFSKLGAETRDMLQKWEAGDEQIVGLWKKMNSWVYAGFDETYKKLKVNFHKNYYESDTYLLGKETVIEGIKRGVFQQDDDGSVWVDLTDIGMDRKIVLRSDGTAVYMTQDLGTAMLRYKDYGVSKMIYTVADEQDYHFKVLFEILKRLNEPYADGLFHLSYGMVDLTTGKMKSREGTVVDADDLIIEVIEEARANSQERGELAELHENEQQDIIEKIGLGALKFFILKVHPKKRMTFDPTESVDMQGQTGPYIQNAFVRIQSLFRKNNTDVYRMDNYTSTIHESEKELIKLLISFPETLKEAAKFYDPSTVANFAYLLAKEYHRFYHDVRILGAASSEEKNFRLELSRSVGEVLKISMDLLGIEMPSRM